MNLKKIVTISIVFVAILFTRISFSQDIPSCITAMTTKKESNKEFAGRRTVSQGRIVYAVNIKRPPRCMDCPSGITYYDSICTAVASFTIGYAPAAFIKPGYSASDFTEARSPMFANKLKASVSYGSTMVPFSTPASFIVSESFDTVMRVFEKEDQLTISATEGLIHYRDGKLVNSYKIIPQKIKQQYISPCQVPPCPTRQDDRIVYYLEPFKRYIDISILPDRAWFRVSKKTFDHSAEASSFKEGDWDIWYRLKKKP